MYVTSYHSFDDILLFDKPSIGDAFLPSLLPVYTNSFLVQLNMRYTMRQQLSATPTALMASVPPMHSSLGPQPHLHLPAPSNSQSQSQSYLQSSTYSYPNSKPSANIPSGSQSGSNPYAHPVYAPEHYPADMHMRAGNQEPAGAKFRDAKHLAPPDPFQTFASSSTSHSYSNPSAPAPTPEAEHIRPLPAPPNPVRYLSAASTLCVFCVLSNHVHRLHGAHMFDRACSRTTRTGWAPTCTPRRMRVCAACDIPDHPYFLSCF
jgi:hypothetical protein